MRGGLLHGGRTLRKLIALIFILQVVLSGCALRGHGGSSANQRAERLAIEKGKLSQTTDPVAETQSYIVISDILLSFAADAAADKAYEDFRELLSQFGQTIRTARETIVNSEIVPSRGTRIYSEFGSALGRQVQTLQDLRKKLSVSDQGPIDQAIQIASSIREEMSNMGSRATD
jgi:hypothetical protein